MVRRCIDAIWAGKKTHKPTQIVKGHSDDAEWGLMTDTQSLSLVHASLASLCTI